MNRESLIHTTAPINISNRGRCLLPVLALALAVAPASWSGADSIRNSKHNLSASGPGSIKASSETGICIFCHTTHSGARQAPLWNRYSSGAIYQTYNSSTAKAMVGQPTGSSKLCLSCHDGTVALGLLRRGPQRVEFQDGTSVLPPGRSRLATDLGDDHPISFVYDPALASANGQLHSPLGLNGPIRLDPDRQLQCTSCHDPHDNRYGKFLVASNEAGALCTTCHNQQYWAESSHRTSTATWNGQGKNPWPHTDRTTVQANGCENCHSSHAAGGRARLLLHAAEEENCYSCHDGSVAATDMKAEFAKSSAHPVAATTGVHDPTEDPVNAPRHVECVDCHNPHAVQSTPAAMAAAASGDLATGAQTLAGKGSLIGVAGISSAGTVVERQPREHEVCYRCHADSVDRGRAQVNRQIVETNKRLQFRSSNASYHPVETSGKNPDVPSLLHPWTTASVMDCSACHNNDQGPAAGGGGPRGPHGSRNEALLERRLVFKDFQSENSGNYAMCYKCHSRESVLGDESFAGHRLHVVEVQAACTTCHDSHGVASNPHLINFNRDYVSPSAQGPIRYISNGPRSGSCTLSCHGRDHDALPYRPN